MPRKKVYKPKICDVCGSEFVPNSPTQKRCSKECKKAATEAVAASYREANREKILEYKAAYRKANRGRQREYMLVWRAANKDKIREWRTSYLEANREKIREQKASYYAANKDQFIRRKHNRRALEKNVASDPTVCKTKLHILSGGRCNACGVMTDLEGPDSPVKAHLDHIVPLSHTGTHTWDNVQILCRSCNLSKSDKVQWDFEPKNPHEEDTMENPFRSH
jgi:5-methylcytosine-specific restriction endonuclease McrA